MNEVKYIGDEHGFTGVCDYTRVFVSRLKANPVLFQSEFCRKMTGKRPLKIRDVQAGDDYTTMDPTLWNKMQMLEQKQKQKLVNTDSEDFAKNMQNLQNTQKRVSYGMFWYRIKAITELSQ